MTLSHRPVADRDLPAICGFPQDEEELFFLYPRAAFPLQPAELAAAIAQRSDSTVVERDGRVVAFANFYRWQRGGSCAIGNVVVSPATRGQGVGRYLIRQMIDLALSLGAFLVLYSRLLGGVVLCENEPDGGSGQVALT